MMHQRHSAALAAVLLVHGAALWALQNGLLPRVPEPITPPEMLVEVMTAEPAPSNPRVTTQRPSPAIVPAKPQVQKAMPQDKPELVPVAVAPLPPSVSTPVVSPVPQSALAGPVLTSAANSAPSHPARALATASSPTPALQLPSSDADYLNNPKPSYPAMSQRLGEQGNVVVHTLIGADGVPQKAEILSSSGFERLDRAALETALKWRYVPGKRAGVAEAMWFKVPLRFVLN